MKEHRTYQPRVKGSLRKRRKRIKRMSTKRSPYDRFQGQEIALSWA